MRRLQLQLPLLPLRDVEADAEQSHRPAGGVAQQLPAAADPSCRAVRPPDPVVVGEVGPMAPGQHVGRLGVNAVEVPWIDHGAEADRARDEAGGIDAEEMVVHVVPVLDASPQVDVPGAHAAGGQGQLQPQLAVLQRQRRPLLLGDVDDVAVQVPATFLRRLDDPSGLAHPALLLGPGVGDAILHAVGFAVLLAPALGLEIAGQIVRMDQPVPVRGLHGAGQLHRIGAEDLHATFVVAEGTGARDAADEDDAAQILHQRPEPVLAFPQALGRLPFHGHISAGAPEAAEAPLRIADGGAVDANDALLPVIVAQREGKATKRPMRGDGGVMRLPTTFAQGIATKLIASAANHSGLSNSGALGKTVREPRHAHLIVCFPQPV